MRILYIGCVLSSYEILEELLINQKDICGVITRPDNGFHADYKDLGQLCMKYRINNIHYTNDINDNDTADFIIKARPDIIYCFGWSQLLKESLLQIPRIGVVGFHPARLPYNKGRHPIIWAIVLGLSETASTFFMIDSDIDHGPIVSQNTIAISIKDDAHDLYKKILKAAKQQAIDITNRFENNKIQYIEQDPGDGNIWRKRSRHDGKIDFRMPAICIYNLVRALTRPYVGAHIEHCNVEYKVWKTEVVADSEDRHRNIEPGKILEVYSSRSFLVKSGDHLIKILDCQDIELKVGDYL